MAIQIRRIVILILISLKLCYGLQLKTLNFEKNGRVCEEQAKQPYFDINTIIGKPWRIYYTWNMNMDTKCLDMIVKNATVSVSL